MSTKYDPANDPYAQVEGYHEDSKQRTGTFFSLFDGSICLRSKEVPPADQGWDLEPVETMNPKKKTTVYTYVKRYRNLIARIVDFNVHKQTFDDGGKVTNYNFTILAQGKKAMLQTTYGATNTDSLLRKFLKVAPNIDFSIPILFGAFKKVVDGKTQQIISIRQGPADVDPKDWKPVAFYWQKKVDENGNVRMDTKAKAADGTVLPDPEHDSEDDTWDFKAQNKFLSTYFKDNVAPKIKSIAAELGIKNIPEANADDSFPSHTGGPVASEIPEVTEKPADYESKGVSDAMTPEQAAELRKLCTQIGKKPDKLAQGLFECDFDDLSIRGAAYMKYKIGKKIKKARKEDPNAYPEPKEQPKAAPAEEADSSDWTAPKPPKAAAKESSSSEDD